MRKLIIFFTCILCYSSSSAQIDIQSEKLNAVIEQGMHDWQIPGLAAIVVKDGKIVFKKTYGIRDIETQEPVDANTTFSMASTTKAIIAISIGILVDQGKIKWNDKVQEYLPTFRLSDPYITANARVKDLLTHNLGFGNEDFLWLADSTSTTEMLKKFGMAKSIYPLRGGFNYQNIMYAIAGELIEAVSKQSWTNFVKNNVFVPLGIFNTYFSSKTLLSAGNHASPHYNDLEDGVVKIGLKLHPQVGPAGGIWSSANDIGNYLLFLTNNGVYNNDTILRPETFDYLFEPHSILTKKEYYSVNMLTKPNWNTYGLGWFQQDYRGYKLDFHTGSIQGLVSLAGVMRKHNFAVYVFANLDHAELRQAILYKAIDLYVFNDDNRDWNDEILELCSKFKEQTIKSLEKRDEERVYGTTPSLALSEFSGTYKNEMYGKIDVKVVGNNLLIDVNNYLNYKMMHWNYNTFITNKDTFYRQKFLVNFNLNQSAKIDELKFWGKTFTKIEHQTEK